MDLARYRSDVLRDHDAYRDEFVRDVLRRARASDRRRASRALLVTAPHAVVRGVADRAGDPCTERLADALGRAVTSTVIKARRHRSEADQNRIAGLFGACDMMPTLRRVHRSARHALHVDVHSFFPEVYLPDGWGTGLNLICLHGDDEQHALAARLRDHLRARLRECPVTIVVMEAYPVSEHDANSNAICEWARTRGMRSVLIEFPVRLEDGTWRLAHHTADEYARALGAFAERLPEAPAR